MHDALAASEPVVLLGRGGSGTRVLSELALANGVFLGNRVNVSGDSVEWVEALYPLAVEAADFGVAEGSERDASWRDALMRRAAAILGAAGREARDPWGWKLPETTVALPQVVRTFPRARVVHLVRHPVTISLRRTHMTSRLDNPVGRAVLYAAYRTAGRDARRIADDGEAVHNALSWDYQMRTVLDALDARPAGVRVMQLHYEDVCADPVAALAQVAAFLERPAPDAASAPAIEPGRTNEAAIADERAEAIWAICEATAARLGYRRGAHASPARIDSASAR
jgi:LPS sulfotransferase NodH